MSDLAATPFRSIPAAARHAAEAFVDTEAVVAGDTRWSFADVGRRVDEAARAFAALGVEPGDRVAIWAPNRPEWVVALFGLQSAGAALVPLTTRFKGQEAADILRRSRARALVTVDEFLGSDFIAMLDGHELPDLRHRIVIGHDRPGTLAWEAFLHRAADVEREEIDRRVAALGPDDVSDVIFTSGTTGAPKGVVSRHGQSVRAFQTWVDIVGLEAGDRYLLVNPMSHTFGYKAGIVACQLAGATLVPLPSLDVDAALDVIPRERISVLAGAPTLYQTLLNHPRLASADLSSLRLAVTGAAVIPTELVRRMRDDLGFDTVITAYGLTEATGFVTACRRGDDVETIATTSGRAIPGVEVQVVDDESKEVPRGEPGEIVCRGYNVMRGYFEDPEQTAEAIDRDGWLHTGDIGVMDDGGNIRITDRKKDMYIYGGFNVYPAEVENALLAHPGIAQAAVVGVPDVRLGEVGVAFVIPRTGEAVDPDAVIAWSKERMANYKVPRVVQVVESLPVNAIGKVLKYELREKAKSE
ncbi:MAG: FadD3 family acyl-CoA ligase [Acidimicrobiales bacterium]